MNRLPISRLRSLGRRNLSHSPELPRRRSTTTDHKTHSLPSACGAPIVAPSIPRFHHTLSNGRSSGGFDPRRGFSSSTERDDLSLEEDVERKAGWLLKLIFVATGGLVAYQFFPYMGDNLLQQSISLLHVKDPLFKRMGASRLSRYAIDDERRMRVVEMGGAHKLLNVLEAAKDDKTRKEALKALSALSHSDEAAEVLQQAGAISIIHLTPNSADYKEVETYKLSLLKRFQELKYDISPLEGDELVKSLCS